MKPGDLIKSVKISDFYLERDFPAIKEIEYMGLIELEKGLMFYSPNLPIMIDSDGITARNPPIMFHTHPEEYTPDGSRSYPSPADFIIFMQCVIKFGCKKSIIIYPTSNALELTSIGVEKFKERGRDPSKNEVWTGLLKLIQEAGPNPTIAPGLQARMVDVIAKYAGGAEKICDFDPVKRTGKINTEKYLTVTGDIFGFTHRWAYIYKLLEEYKRHSNSYCIF